MVTHSVASVNGFPSSRACDDFEFSRVDSDVDSCWSGASVVSVVFNLVCLSCPVLASCDAEMCPDELWERESVERGIVFSVRSQCSPSGVHPFSNVSVNVERASQPEMAAGSGQGWRSLGVAGSGRGNQRFHESCQKRRHPGCQKWRKVLNRSIRNSRSKKMKKRWLGSPSNWKDKLRCVLTEN